MHIITAGHGGFGLIAPGCQACRHNVFIKREKKMACQHEDCFNFDMHA